MNLNVYSSRSLKSIRELTLNFAWLLSSHLGLHITIVCLSPIASKFPQGDKLKKSESNQFSFIAVLIEEDSKFLDSL